MPFHAVPFRDRLLNRLVKKAATIDVERGAAVFRAGEEAREVVLVREGHLLLESGRPEEDGRVVDVVLPWEVGGVDAILRSGVHRWTAVAGESSRVQRLDGQAVRRVLKRAEGTFDAFLGASLGRLDLARELGGGRGTTARRRLALVLVHLGRRATDEAAEGRGGGPETPLELPFALPHRVLGDVAGLHRSTVTTVLNDWIYRDLLEDLERGWRIPGPGALLEDGS